MNRERIPDLVSEINEEMKTLESLVEDIRETFAALPSGKKRKRIYEESLALKLHNFYTGCERIFQKIAGDINGGAPDSFDWHKRLLHSMSLEIEKKRPPVISKDTAKALEEYLAFRHVVRNIYGFEIESDRLEKLIVKIYKTFGKLKKDMTIFIKFLREIAA